MKKAGIVIIAIVTLLCVGVTVSGVLLAKKVKEGDFSVLSNLSFLNKAAKTDLGVTFTPEDSAKFHKSIQSEVKAITIDSAECKRMNCVPGQAIYVGSQRINTEISSEQGTALINEWIQLSPNAPFTAAQMKVNADGTVQFAGVVDMQQVKKFGIASKVPTETMQLVDKYVGALGGTFPLNASGTASIKNNKVTAQFTSVQLGVIPVPATILKEYKGQIENFVSDRLPVVQGLYIEELSFKNGKATFTGSIPKTIYFVK